MLALKMGERKEQLFATFFFETVTWPEWATQPKTSSRRTLLIRDPPQTPKPSENFFPWRGPPPPPPPPPLEKSARKTSIKRMRKHSEPLAWVVITTKIIDDDFCYSWIYKVFIDCSSSNNNNSSSSNNNNNSGNSNKTTTYIIPMSIHESKPSVWAFLHSVHSRTRTTTFKLLACDARGVKKTLSSWGVGCCEERRLRRRRTW